MISDILGLIKDLKDIDNYTAENEVGQLNFHHIYKTSISRKSRESIFHFPVLITDSIDFNTLLMLSKALEREYTIFTRIALSLDDIIVLKDTSDFSKKEFLRNQHQNMNIKNPSFGMLQDVVNESKKLLVPFESNFNNKTLNEQFPVKYNGIAKNYFKSKGILNEIGNNSNINEIEKSYIGGENKGGRYNAAISPQEVKKNNEMEPTLLNIELTLVANGTTTPVHMLLGIKTVAHIIPSSEMIFNIANSIKEKRLLFKAVQWTTGEIKFIKDFLLNIDGMREQALKSRTNSKYWRMLRQRSMIDKFRRMTFSKNSLLPNATIVITYDEMQQIKNVHNIDLMNVREATKLMDLYFLLGLVVVDTGAEIAHFLFDGYNDYQSFTYDALERESRGDSYSEIKKVVNLMNRNLR